MAVTGFVLAVVILIPFFIVLISVYLYFNYKSTTSIVLLVWLMFNLQRNHNQFYKKDTLQYVSLFEKGNVKENSNSLTDGSGSGEEIANPIDQV